MKRRATAKTTPPTCAHALRVVDLFAGIGGFDLGMSQAGHTAVAAAEVWGPARAVLSDRMPHIELLGDVTAIKELPPHDLLSAGFPCTDLSQAGATKGISGPSSGLVQHVFRLARQQRPVWIVLENVPNLLVLHRGEAMSTIVRELEDLGYRWAYRVVDSRATGIPQRRLRVILLASREYQPERILLDADVGPPESNTLREDAYGFYWTEGRGGLGWAQDAIPTLKGGSTIGINSAPAVWLPHAERGRRLLVPSVSDGERFQGLPAGWTSAASVAGERDQRWKLVGNAVTVGVAAWLGEALACDPDLGAPLTGASAMATPDGGWPAAAFGHSGAMWRVDVSAWPVRRSYQHLAQFMDVESAQALSHRAAMGFLKRLDESNLRIDPRFVHDVEGHVRHTRPSMSAPGHQTASKSTIDVLPPGSWASSTAARHRMQANRGRDTKPELALRRLLHARGLRYRVQTRPTPELRNRLDIVFRTAKVAVDVRGCFWHACDQHSTKPKANAEIWARKLQQNIERDTALERRLSDMGWHLEIVWEHEDSVAAADRVEAVVASRRPATRN